MNAFYLETQQVSCFSVFPPYSKKALDFLPTFLPYFFMLYVVLYNEGLQSSLISLFLNNYE